MQGWSLRSLAQQSTDFAAPVVNRGGRPMLVTRAALIPAAGHPAPRLVGVNVGTTNIAWSGRGWPPGAGSRPLPTSLPPGRSWIYYGVAGSNVGFDYFALGVRLSYHERGRDRTVDLWGPGVVCVRTNVRPADHRCSHDGQLALDQALRLGAG